MADRSQVSRSTLSASVTPTPARKPVPLIARGQALLLTFASVVVAVLFLALVAIVVVVVAWIVFDTAGVLPAPDRQWPRLSVLALVAIPVVAVLLAFLINRGSAGRTFYAQQQANRRISLLLLVAMVGLVVALGEIIAASISFDAYGALVGAAIAALVGLGAAGYAHFNGPRAVLASARARRIDDTSAPGAASTVTGNDRVLIDVVRELSLAAGMAAPQVYVINDASLNAFAVGTKPANAAVAVTSGLLGRLDREQLQGVVAHELGHIRNFDSRYGVYVAIMVGLVALVTDGFLRIVVRAWQEGVFLRGASDADDVKEAAAGLTIGLGLGVVLLAAALFLRLFAPIASLLVQAAVSRQREFLADATSVELTRNPTALARALAELRSDRDPLDFANRGSQHLWFTSPIGDVSDGRWHLLATHPTLEARIERLAALYPSGVIEVEAGTAR